ncbi:MAG: 3-hydroxyacyl-CoA dehydrogenase/enoyl-CoA hydratase family protein [Alphaproteobacteria bacterium]
MSPIQKIAVLGSGVMGSQIAAQAANAGVPVLLLDIVPKDAKDRNQLAKGALERMQKADPAPFMHAKAIKLVTPGNLEDDLQKLADVDWIVEAVLENPQVKSDIYKKIDAARKTGSIVSSNTSTIPLHILTGGQSEQFARDFLVTHFFNPPRYMRLLELVAGPKTRPDAVTAVSDFIDKRMGKGIVICKDTPGFIANRIGTFFMQTAINATLDLGLSVETADAVCGKPMGVPKTGVFGLIDLVGLDLMPLIAKSFMETLPPDDEYRKIYREPDLFKKMIADGYTGRKGKGGFYRINKEGGGKVKEAIDLKTGEYRPASKEKHPAIESAGKDLRALCSSSEKAGQLAWSVLSQTLSYAASLVPQIADDVVGVDSAMRWGYNWDFGPFELIDKLGAAWLAEKLKAENRPVPELLKLAGDRSFYKVQDGKLHYLMLASEYKPVPRAEGVLLLEDVKRAGKPVLKNASASLWDIGDGVACFEYHTKMNTIDPDLLGMLHKSVELLGSDRARWRGMVIYNEGKVFSAGANLGLAMFAINLAMYQAIDQLIEQGQAAYRAVRFAPFPVVGAPANLALGGGCEILLNCAAVQAHAELYTGLVEVGIGVVPGWGGCAQMLGRTYALKKGFGGPIPPLVQAFETIGTAKVSKSAAEAVDLMYLRPTDGITMNRDRLLFDAKQKAIELAKDYKPPEEETFKLAGKTGRAAVALAIEGFRAAGKATPHDVVVGKKLAEVLTGGDLPSPQSEADILTLERKAFFDLVRHPDTQARIEYMLANGKPLRN